MKTRPRSAHPLSNTGDSRGGVRRGSTLGKAADPPVETSSTKAFTKKVGALKDKQRTFNADMLSDVLKTNNTDNTGVTVLGFEANSYIKDQNVRRDSNESRFAPSPEPTLEISAVPAEEGEISGADAFRIDAFHRLKNRKTQVFEDPSLQKDMQKKRLYKDNKIVAGLANHRPGFLRHRDERLTSMHMNAKNAYLSRQSTDFGAAHRPKFLDFTKHKKHSSKIENVPRFDHST